MSEEHAAHPYYKVFAWLTFLTILELGWALMFKDASRALLASGLGIMATIKAAMVGLFYMHLKYEGKLLWAAILFPLVLVVVMISGLLPDALAPYSIP